MGGGQITDTPKIRLVELAAAFCSGTGQLWLTKLYFLYIYIDTPINNLLDRTFAFKEEKEVGIILATCIFFWKFPARRFTYCSSLTGVLT